MKGIVGDDLQRRFAKPKLRSLKRIAIDEVDLGKKHKFLSSVLTHPVEFDNQLLATEQMKSTQYGPTGI